MTKVKKSRITEHEIRQEAMRSYAEWLHSELKLLNREMAPDYEALGNWSYCNTAAAEFHFPRDDGFAGWQRNPPSSRAMPMMRALGIDIAKHLRRERREGVVWPQAPKRADTPRSAKGNGA